MCGVVEETGLFEMNARTLRGTEIRRVDHLRGPLCFLVTSVTWIS